VSNRLCKHIRLNKTRMHMSVRLRWSLICGVLLALASGLTACAGRPGGLQGPNGVAVASDGSLYVIQHSTGPQFFAMPGDLVKVSPDGQRTVLVSNLNRPTSLVVDSDGSVYYTNRGITAGAGEVWKYVP